MEIRKIRSKVEGTVTRDSRLATRDSLTSQATQLNARDSRLATRAMTLIELLVVIVILTTLVGGVIPVLSPNNDTRKIRAAARGLQSYINLVQAQAARTGRPHGIAFRESSPGSGVALEVFGLEVPQSFAGFSEDSRTWMLRGEDFRAIIGPPEILRYGNVPNGNNGTVFSPQLDGRDLYILSFQLGMEPLNGTADPVVLDQLPPRMFRVGDTVDVDGNQFLIVDDADYFYIKEQGESPKPLVHYLDISQNGIYQNKLVCVWLNENGQVAPQRAKRYKIRRRPTNSADAPYQLPAGIVIDMQGSIAEGSDSVVLTNPRFPTPASLYTDRSALLPINRVPNVVGIMFSPTGAVDSVIFNGNELPSVSRLVLMLGRIENGGIDPDPNLLDLTKSEEAPWTLQDGEKIEDVQERINWLNLDSRLLSIVASSGRTVVSEVAFVDPTLPGNLGENDRQAAALQIEAAHTFAHEMTTAK